MNYKNIYNQIISNAQERRIGQDSHHIIPKSLGGSNNSSNLVLLTHKEHYVCHHLLMKFNRCKETIYAFRLMTHTRAQRITARVFENLKKDFATVVSNTHKGKIVSSETRKKLSDLNKGKKHSAETKALWSKQRKGTRVGKDNPMHGKKQTKEAIAKMIVSRSGTNHPSVNGYYVTPWGKFLTAGEASKHLDVSINLTSLRKWCKQNDKTVRAQSFDASPYLNKLGSSIVGRTFSDLGFSYLPMYDLL